MKKVLQTFRSADGQRLVEIFDHQNGYFSYEESCEAVEDIPDLGPETYWMTSHISGLFDSAEAAESDARLGIGWLRAVAG